MRWRTARSLLTALVVETVAGPGLLAGQQPVSDVTLRQFHQLTWLQGSWLGSGGAYPAFYEEYRAVDDSTIQMWAYGDSAFRVATDSSSIALRGGKILKTRGGKVQYLVVVVGSDRIRFLRPGATHGGFTFTRRSDNEWIATLHPSRPDAKETIYTMRRLHR